MGDILKQILKNKVLKTRSNLYHENFEHILEFKILSIGQHNKQFTHITYGRNKINTRKRACSGSTCNLFQML